MTDYMSEVVKNIRKATEAYTDTLATLSKAFEQSSKKVPRQTGHIQMMENWLRVARMSKDGLVISIEQGFEVWERECRRLATSAKSDASDAASPFEACPENWSRAAEALLTGSEGWSGEAQKFAEAVQKSLKDSLRAWQSLWEPPAKS